MAGTPPVLSVGFLFSYSSSTLIGARVDDQLIDDFVHHQLTCAEDFSHSLENLQPIIVQRNEYPCSFF